MFKFLPVLSIILISIFNHANHYLMFTSMMRKFSETFYNIEKIMKKKSRSRKLRLLNSEIMAGTLSRSHISPIGRGEPNKVKEKIYVLSPNAAAKTNLRNKVAVCACAKCGSTSFFTSLYNETFGHEWEFTQKPWAQDLTSVRWKGVAEQVKFPSLIKDIPFSFALYRDPKERIISSWKSKIACSDEGYSTNFNEVLVRTKDLLNLAGLNEPKDCLSFDEFLETLMIIYKKGEEAKLDIHFLPQYLGCFRYSNPNEWTIVTTIGSEGAKCMLRRGISNDSHDDCDFLRTHSTGYKSLEISSKQAEMLRYVTTKEYNFFSLYNIF